jgi:uncharacterized protein (TIGR03084 family)
VAGDLGALLVDLQAETDSLNTVLGAASDQVLAAPTPAAGWSVADTIGHLWYFDREGRRALQDPEGFTAGLEALIADPEAFMANHVAEIRGLGTSVLPSWHEERRLIIDALRATDPKARVPWYGPPMSPMSFGTARLMETWAHGQDVADALGTRREPTDRLRHIAHLGVRTREFSYAIKGREAPAVPIFVGLTGPRGDEWTWGDPDAAQRVTGTALDFCLLVTQRRLFDDLALTASGDAALEWMSIAQAFAGEPSMTDQSRHGLPATTD